MKYDKFNPEVQRRETWKELVDRNKEMHQKKFPQLKDEIEEVYKMVYDKKILPSMRSMQFAGKPIEISPNRVYNCAYMPIDDWRAFGEAMFLLLGCTGVGYSVKRHHVEKLPEIRRPDTKKNRRYLISDSIEVVIVERYASADNISSIVYKAVKDSKDLSNLDKIFADAKKEATKMLADRKRTSDGLVQCVIPNTITYSGGLGKNKIHPTQKPTEVLEYFIELLSNEGDVVLDTFAGSGSTGVACNKLNRNCVLIERDTVMFGKMQARFNELSTDQLDTDLFEIE
jgi:hypothetical protein